METDQESLNKKFARNLAVRRVLAENTNIALNIESRFVWKMKKVAGKRCKKRVLNRDARVV